MEGLPALTARSGGRHDADVSDPVFERPPDLRASLAGRAAAVRFLELPPVRAVMVDGEGGVGPDAFAPLMPGLYGAAYTLRNVGHTFSDAYQRSLRP